MIFLEMKILHVTKNEMAGTESTSCKTNEMARIENTSCKAE